QRSVTGQIEHARAWARARGWVVRDEYVFVDDGISGAEFQKRPGLTRLLNMLRPRPPFQVLITSEESRLGREQIQTAYVIQQILDADVRIFYYLDGQERTLDSATDKVLLSVTGFAAEMKRERAQQRTYAAMLRFADSGYVTGGKLYGYDHVRPRVRGMGSGAHRPPARRVINPAQAAVVHQIFEQSAEGWGITRIAKDLNDAGVPPPRGGSQGSAPTAIREMLHNELYRGRAIWNRTKKAHRRGTKTQDTRPVEDLIEVELPECRIVSEELWEAAHAALCRRAHVFVPRSRVSGEGGSLPPLTPPSALSSQCPRPVCLVCRADHRHESPSWPPPGLLLRLCQQLEAGPGHLSEQSPSAARDTGRGGRGRRGQRARCRPDRSCSSAGRGASDGDRSGGRRPTTPAGA